MISAQLNGHRINWDVKKMRWIFSDGKPIKNIKPCPKCGMLPTKEGHDDCIKNLPGIIYACCGHGIEEGYLYFENGIVIRGKFKIEKA